MSVKYNTCCICGNPFIGFGNNPYPVVKDAVSVCCDICNSKVVIPARLKEMQKHDSNKNKE